MFIQSQMVKSRTTIKDMIQKWTDGQTVKLGKVENTLRDTEGPQNWTERKENTSNEDKLGENERWGVKRTTQRHIRSMRQEQNGEERQDGRGSEWEAETGQQAKESRQEQRPHITRGRLCHGVNGVLPLPIIPVPFEPWPLHTERSLTPRSASFRAPCLLFIYMMSCQQKPGVCPSNPSSPKSALRTFCRNTPI